MITRQKLIRIHALSVYSINHKCHEYPVKLTKEKSYDLFNHGFSIIDKYSKAHFQRYQDQIMMPCTLCLNDLGLESTIKHFGNQTNTIAEILLNLYNLFTTSGMITRATINLNPNELENFYGNRVRSIRSAGLLPRYAYGDKLGY